MFCEPVNRVLISGDALWENGMGFVWPEEGANPRIAAAHEALATIEKLDPAIVIPGHGAPFFQDAAGSIATVRSKLDAFARDPAKNARHVVKVMFVFALLDRQRMAVGERRRATSRASPATASCRSDSSAGRPRRSPNGWSATCGVPAPSRSPTASCGPREQRERLARKGEALRVLRRERERREDADDRVPIAPKCYP